MSDLFDHHGIQPDISRLMALRHVAHQLMTDEQDVSDTHGDRVQKQRGRGMEIADIRHFVDGDDIRLIDRNATARSGAPHIRTVHDEKDSNVLLVADLRPSMFWGTKRALRSVAACEALVIAGWQSVRYGGKVGLLAFTHDDLWTLAPRARETGLVRLIGELARCHAEALRREMDLGEMRSDPPLSDVLDYAARIARPRSRLILATALDTLGAAFETSMRSLNERCHVTCLKISDQIENEAPKGIYNYQTPAGAWGSAAYQGATDVEDMRRLREWGVETRLIDSSCAPEDRAGRWIRHD